MTVAQHMQIRADLAADEECGIPEGRMALTVARREERYVIVAGWIGVGAEAARSSRTIMLLDGDVNVSLDKDGEFLSLEMLRPPTPKERKSYFRWSHEKHAVQPRGHVHLPCLAFTTLAEAWGLYGRLVQAINRYHLAPPEEQAGRALFDLAKAAGVDPKAWTRTLEGASC